MLMAQCAQHGEEGLAGARRQRAIHRVRRRRPRRGRRRARSRRSTATPARPASARTASWCRTGSTTRSRRSSPSAWRSSRSATAWSAGVTIGPLIDDAAVEKVEEHIADAVAKGAKVTLGGKRHALGGLFFEPTVLADVTPAMKVTQGRDLRPGRPALPLQDRGGGDRDGERHRVRARRLLLRARPSAASGACRKGSSTAWSASTPASSPPRWRRSAA